MIAAALFATFTDILGLFLPKLLIHSPVEEILLSAIYEGILGGIGGGLVNRSGQPLSQSYL